MGLIRGLKRLHKQRLKEWGYRVCAATGVIACFRWRNRRRVAVVVYHVVRPAPEHDDPLQVSQRDFERQLETLVRHYAVVGFDQILRAFERGAAGSKPLAVVTFDDGYRTTIRRVAPILRRHGVPATVFVPCGLLGTARPQWHDRVRRAVAELDRAQLRVTIERTTRIAAIPTAASERRAFLHRLTEWLKTLDDQTREEAVRQIEVQAPARGSPDDDLLMDWSDVSDAAAAGLEFGSHTVSHAILPTESATRARWEIEESKRLLEARLGREVTAFCYPNGSYSAVNREMVRQAGYACAVTVEPGLNDRDGDRYALRRIALHAGEGPYTVLAKVSGFEAWVKRTSRFFRPRRRSMGPTEPWDRVLAAPSVKRRRRCECAWEPAQVAGAADRPKHGGTRALKRPGLMHVVHTLLVGGMERLVVDLLDGLGSDRYERYVCCLDERGPLADELERLGVKVYCLHKGAGVRWGLPWTVSRLIRELNIAVVHTHNLSGLLYGGVGAAIGRAKVLVHTEHGRDLEYYGSPTLQRLEGALAHLPHCLVAVSQPLFDELRYSHRIPLSRLLLVGNGVRLERYRVQASHDVRARLGLGPQERVIGIVARLVPVKDHRTMLRATAAVIRALPDVRLLVAGDGPLRADLEAEAERLGIAPRVRFLGVRHDVPELLNAMDVFALSSLSEGMSMTILEAMAARRPVVATDIGGNSWLVHHEKTGLLVPPGSPEQLASAILRLLADRTLAAQLGDAGYRLIRERFQLTQVVQEYDALYQHLLGARP